jgi:N-hydroxyarylamine O-acetyltransferase
MAEHRGTITAPSARRYLDRLGISEMPPPTLDGLRALHAAHLDRVPFENLSIHLGEEIVLDPEVLVAKIVDRRRGGFCYELNGAFATLLQGLGFDVTMLAGRAYDGDQLGPLFDHMCLRVDLDRPWLVDVGFGDNFRLPLHLDDRDDQVDDGRTFRLVDAGDGELELLRDDVPRYRFDLEPRELADYAEACAYHQTSPESPFMRNTVCSLPTPTGRVTIRNSTLIVTHAGEREETTLTAAELGNAYREHFDIDLERYPATSKLHATSG